MYSINLMVRSWWLRVQASCSMNKTKLKVCSDIYH